MKTRRTGCLILIVAVLYVFSAAQAQQNASGLFLAQCNDLLSATVDVYTQQNNGNYTTRTYRIRDFAKLGSMSVSPGVWHNYDNSAPFGGTYPNEDLGSWYSRVVTQTSCGAFETWAWDNGNGTLIIWAFYNMQVKCDANGQHCGRHNFEFYYASVEEWNRATGRESH